MLVQRREKNENNNVRKSPNKHQAQANNVRKRTNDNSMMSRKQKTLRLQTHHVCKCVSHNAAYDGSNKGSNATQNKLSQLKA